MTPSDGSPPYETTDIALVLDRPLASGDEPDNAAIAELIAQLDPAASDIEGRQGWLFVSETLIRAHSEQAELLYSRS
jgi:hypothetical protein